jgi:hypothetical protein
MIAAAQSSRASNRVALVLLLIIAVALFVIGEIAIGAVNGWWSDELFALWASDPSLPFVRIFSERIATDSNPPLYFSLLYAARQLFENDRLAVLALNIAILMAASATVLLASRRSQHMLGAAVVAVAVFILSGPVLAYTAEGRSYLAALAIVFCASWHCVLAVSYTGRRHPILPFIVIGALSALTHPFAALFCGSLAAGLVVLAIFDPLRRDLLWPGLTLGISTTVVFAMWLLWALSALGNIGWVEFTLQAVREAIWYVRKLVVGSWFAVALLAALIAFGFVHRATRPLVVVFGVAFALFVALPLVGSLRQPLVTGRYWMIGASGLVVLVVALAATWWRAEGSDGTVRASRYALVAALLLAMISSISGFLTARAFTAAKPFWEGADTLSALLKSCPAGSVRVGTFKLDKPTPAASVASFAYMSRVAPQVFVDVVAATTPLLRVAQARCPAIAWAEHVQLGDNFASHPTDAELLRLMKIDATPDAVDVRRHGSGFYVLVRGAGR